MRNIKQNQIEKKFLIILGIILMMPLAIAANDPGHDSLYIEQQGDSELNGSLNISQNFTIKGGNLFMNDYLDFYADGGTVSTPSINTIAGTNTYLAIDSPGDVFINRYSNANTVYIGYTGGTVNLNITGALYIQSSTATVGGTNICLENGTNCPSELGGANITGSGADNRVAFWTDGDSLSYDGNLTWNNSNKRLGIGTSSPDEELQIYFYGPTLDLMTTNNNGDSSLTFSGAGGLMSGQLVMDVDTSFQVESRDDLILQSGTDTGEDIIFLTDDGANEAMRILHNGNIGINTTSPNTTLYVVGDINATGDICEETSGNCLSSMAAGDGNITGNGNSGAIAKFTGAGVIADSSILSESGQTLTVNGNISMPTNFYIGNNARATGGSSVAIGQEADATGLRATAIGYQANATDSGAIVIGVQAISTNQSSIAIGENATAATEYSIAIGYKANTTGGQYHSIAIGRDARATLNYATAIGRNANATNYRAIAIGFDSDATGADAIAIGGWVTNATGTGATAIGWSANAIANQAIAVGYNTKATANYAVAIGYGANATAQDSYVFGRGIENSVANTSLFGGNVTAPGLCLGSRNCIDAWDDVNVSSADGNNYTQAISVSGTSTKTIHLNRSGMINLTASFTDDTDDTVSGTELDGVFSANGLLRRTGVGTYASVSTLANLNAAITDATLADSGTLTNGYYCRYDGSEIDCDVVSDGSGDCGSGAVCLGDHTHSNYLADTGDTATGNYTFGSTALHIDDTNDRVGIGTATPSEELEVAGNITQDDNYYHCFGDDCDAYMYFNGTSLVIKVS